MTAPVGEAQDEHPHLSISKFERLSWAQEGGTLSFTYPSLVMQLWVGSCMGLHLLSCLQAPCLARTQHHVNQCLLFLE